MICCKCGKENAMAMKYCSECNAPLEGWEEGSALLEEEADQGFSRPDSLYEGPQLKPELSRFLRLEEEVPPKETRKISDGKHRRALKKDSKAGWKKRRAVSRIEIKQGRMNQQRMEQELKEKLEEEQYQRLSQFMYQGLNQDVSLIDQKENKGRKKTDIKTDIKIDIKTDIKTDIKSDIKADIKTEMKAGIKKGIPILAAVLTVLLAAAIIYRFGIRKDEIDYNFVTRDALEIYADQASQKTYVFNSKGDMLYKLDEFMYYRFTPDHTAALLYNYNSTDCMYVNEEKKIEFSSPLSGVALSDDGNYIIYSVSGGLNKYYLNLYDVRKGTEVLLDKQDKRFHLLNILPGGELITYATYNVTEGGEIQELKSYQIRKQGEPELIGEDILVFAVSYDRLQTYYVEYSNHRMRNVNVKTKDKTVMLSESINGPICFNRDYTQILIEDGGQYYLSVNGAERKKLYPGMLRKVLQPLRGVELTRENGIFCYGFQSFGEKLLLSDNNIIIFLDENFLPKELALSAEGKAVTLARDGESLLYINAKRQLVGVERLGYRNRETVWAEAVEEYRAAPNLTHAYYLKEKELYYKKKGKNEILIDNNVRSICSNAAGDLLFYLKDYTGGKGRVYYSKNGSAAAALEEGEGVSGIMEWNYGVALQKLVNNRNAVFYNTDGLNFTFIMDGVDLIDEDKIKLQPQD